jgi:hypothetical protein
MEEEASDGLCMALFTSLIDKSTSAQAFSLENENLKRN